MAKRTALVTGASRGIGKAIALELARSGCNIIVNYNSSAAEANKLVEEIKKLGQDAIAIQADVGDYEAVRKMIRQAHAKFPTIDILVNNAGIIRDRTLKKMSNEEWHEVIQTNLNGAFYVTKEALQHMGEGGRIIMISSIIGIYGNFGQTNYGAAKAGMIGMAKSLAKELGPKKITVNVVAPGFVKTDIIKDIGFFKEKLLNYMTPLKETADPEDIANAVAFLASPKSRYITGTVINVDGGLAF